MEREVIQCCYMKSTEYVSTADIARILGVSRQAIQKRMDAEMKKREGLPEEKQIRIRKMGRGYLYLFSSLPEEFQKELQEAQSSAVEQAKGLKVSRAGNLDFKKELWGAADKLRGNIDAAEYKHIVLGLLFLKYISDAFNSRREQLQEWTSNPRHGGYYIADSSSRSVVLEDKDQYLSEGIFFVPEKARWEHLREQAMNQRIATHIENAMEVIEQENPKLLRGVLPKDRYTRAQLDPHILGELVNIFSRIQFDHDVDKERDLLGEVYEYFLGQFADAEGKRGGEFYTPRSLVRLLVEILEPFENARIFDPACGSGGMFVQSSRFLKTHHKDPRRVSISGQESNPTTYKLCKMNLAIRGIIGNIEVGNTYYDDKFASLRADFVLANPPFNAEWDPKRLSEGDPRIKYGTPPGGNANFMWIQHFIHHLAPNGMAGFVMANGALAAGGREGEMRKKIIDADLVDVIVACPPKLFYNVSLPVSLWFLAKDKTGDRFRNRSGQTLFIDAREQFKLISRKQAEFTDDHIAKITKAVRAWRGEAGAGKYADVPGFCKAATKDEIAQAGYVLTPGRFVGLADEVDDGVPFAEKLKKLSAELTDAFKKGDELEAQITANLKKLKV